MLPSGEPQCAGLMGAIDAFVASSVSKYRGLLVYDSSASIHRVGI